MLRFLAHFLVILAAWTITVKYLFPMGYALAEGVPVLTYVYWDFWPVVHVWLAWALIARPRYTFALAVAVSAVEIAIVVTKFVVFFQSEPAWTIWQTNWFINKVFVLACFVVLLPTAIQARRAGVLGGAGTGTPASEEVVAADERA